VTKHLSDGMRTMVKSGLADVTSGLLYG